MGIVFLAHVHAINIGFPGAHELRCLVNARFSGCQMKATLAAAPLLASVDWEDSCHFFCSAVQGPQPCRGICFQWPAQRTHPQGGRLFLPGLPLSSPDPNEPPTQPSSSSQASCPWRDDIGMPGCPLVAGHFQLLLSPFPSATRAGQLLFPPEKFLAALREGNSRRRRSGDSAQEVDTAWRPSGAFCSQYVHGA